MGGKEGVHFADFSFICTNFSFTFYSVEEVISSASMIAGSGELVMMGGRRKIPDL